MKQAVLMRYTLIPYWYTLFFHAVNASTTVVQPLFFEYELFDHPLYRDIDHLSSFRYPNDANTYNIDQQFLVGRALLVSPNLVSVNIQLE